MTWPPSLAFVSTAVGVLIMITRLPGVISPSTFREQMLRFPRSVMAGRVLIGIVAVIAGYNLYQASVNNWSWARPLVLIGVPVAYLLVIRYADQFLAVRGAAALVLLLARVMLLATDRSEHPMRLLVVVLAYLWVVAGIWMAVAPHHFRDVARFIVNNDTRCRAVCGGAVVLGAFLTALGAFVY
jgi:hypothetical protein